MNPMKVESNYCNPSVLLKSDLGLEKHNNICVLYRLKKKKILTISALM